MSPIYSGFFGEMVTPSAYLPISGFSIGVPNKSFLRVSHYLYLARVPHPLGVNQTENITFKSYYVRGRKKNSIGKVSEVPQKGPTRILRTSISARKIGHDQLASNPAYCVGQGDCRGVSNELC